MPGKTVKKLEEALSHYGTRLFFDSLSHEYTQKPMEEKITQIRELMATCPCSFSDFVTVHEKRYKEYKNNAAVFKETPRGLQLIFNHLTCDQDVQETATPLLNKLKQIGKIDDPESFLDILTGLMPGLQGMTQGELLSIFTVFKNNELYSLFLSMLKPDYLSLYSNSLAGVIDKLLAQNS